MRTSSRSRIGTRQLMRLVAIAGVVMGALVWLGRGGLFIILVFLSRTIVGPLIAFFLLFGLWCGMAWFGISLLISVYKIVGSMFAARPSDDNDLIVHRPRSGPDRPA